MAEDLVVNFDGKNLTPAKDYTTSVNSNMVIVSFPQKTDKQIKRLNNMLKDNNKIRIKSVKKPKYIIDLDSNKAEGFTDVTRVQLVGEAVDVPDPKDPKDPTDPTDPVDPADDKVTLEDMKSEKNAGLGAKFMGTLKSETVKDFSKYVVAVSVKGGDQVANANAKADGSFQVNFTYDILDVANEYSYKVTLDDKVVLEGDLK